MFVASGRYDLGTPYSATDWSLAQLDAPAEVLARITHRYYDAGHMMYTRRADLAQLAADLAAWLRTTPDGAPLRCVLSLAEGARPLTEVLRDAAADTPVLFLSGPEGGLSPQEDAAARSAGFLPVTLGPRVLRAETAALAALVQALA